MKGGNIVICWLVWRSHTPRTKSGEEKGKLRHKNRIKSQVLFHMLFIGDQLQVYMHCIPSQQPIGRLHS